MQETVLPDFQTAALAAVVLGAWTWITQVLSLQFGLRKERGATVVDISLSIRKRR